MSWTESASSSFACRHSSAAPATPRVFSTCSSARANGSPRASRSSTTEITVVLHDSPHALALSNPLLPAIWGLTAKPARRYVAGWVGRHELHVLSPRALRERASRVSGSFEMLALAPGIAVRQARDRGVPTASCSGRGCPSRSGRSCAGPGWWRAPHAGSPARAGTARSVVGQYLRAGHRPQFPPSARDAPLLAAELDRIAGRAARATQRSRDWRGRLHTGGPRCRSAERVSRTRRCRASRANGARGCGVLPTADNREWPTTRNSPSVCARC